MAWEELAPGSGMWRHEYDAGVTLANSVAIDLGDGRLAVISPASTADDAHFAETEALGKVVALVAPSDAHDMGQARWQERFPDAAAYGPAGALPKLGKLGLRSFQDVTELALPEGVQLIDAEGAKTGSVMLRSTRGERPTAYLDEVISNGVALPSHPMFKFLFWITGSGPGLKVNRVYGMLFTRDKVALRQAATSLIDDDTVVCFAHGAPAEGAAVRALLAP